MYRKEALWFPALAVLAVGVTLAEPASAAPAAPKPAAPTNTPAPPQGLVPELPAMTGDRLNVTVAGEDALSKTYAVDAEGNIVVPMLGKIPVKGLMPSQVRDKLSQLLAKFIRDPQVSVEFAERAQITVGFTGMVGKPGPVTLRKGSHLLDALADAGGLVPLEADPQHARLQRRGEKEARDIDVSRLLQGDVALNVELQEGDAVYVPRVPMRVIHVLGAVNKPGEITRKDPPTLVDAILAAGGVAPEAEKKQVQILRSGKTDPELINLDEVLSGAGKNVLLQDGDTVTVPSTPIVTVKVFGYVAKPGESPMKVGTTALEAITAAGGFQPDADRRAVFITASTGEVRRLDLAKLDSPDGLTALKTGDRLFVPQQAPRHFAVAGGVHEPGQFAFPTEPGKKVFLTDALASGKGLVDRAKKKDIVVLRKDPKGGPPQIIPVDFDAYLKHKNEVASNRSQRRKEKNSSIPDDLTFLPPQANPEILPDDVVYVDVDPERRQKDHSWLSAVGTLAGAFMGI